MNRKDKALVKFLWDRVMSTVLVKEHLPNWNPLCSLEHAWMMSAPMRGGLVGDYPLFLCLGDDGGMYWRATVHHQYDFMVVASAVDEYSPQRAICMAVKAALEKGKIVEKPKFWQMWQKPDTPKVGVGVVLKDRSGRVLLGKRKGSHGKGEWSLPGGHVELGESMLVACSREAKEETGIDIYGISPVGFSNDVFEDDGLHYVTLFFEGMFDKKQKAKNREPDKTEKWMWFGKGEIPSPLFPPLKKAIGDVFS